MLIPLLFLSFCLTAWAGCTSCSVIGGRSQYCPFPPNCGNIVNGVQLCSDGSQARVSPCCYDNHPAILAQERVEQAVCSSTEPRQRFRYDPATRLFKITTLAGVEKCLDIYWGEYCDFAPTPLFLPNCDPPRVEQQWVQAFSVKIFSSKQFNGIRTYCLSSQPGASASEAAVELATSSNPSQEWTFNWTGNVGTLRSAYSGQCLQMPSALYGTTTTSSAAATTRSSSSSATQTPSPGVTVWSGAYQTNSGCNTATCCCPTGSFTLVQVDTRVSGTMSITGQCGGSTLLPFSFTLAFPTSTTVNTPWLNGQPLTITKTGVIVTLTNGGASQCSTTFTCTSGDCARSASTTPCFHALTLISYKGGKELLSLEQLQSGKGEAECKVPHVVVSKGVTITCKTSNNRNAHTLRLTDDHLVYTTQGLRPAATLVASKDILFTDLGEKEMCHVVSVTKETEEQTYFGLNCVESIVLANGIKASTFGTYHTIPALWMKYASKVMGVHYASSVGDSIATALLKMKFI